MFALALLIPTGPTIPGAPLTIDAQWAAILACPKVSVPEQKSGTGVVVSVKDGMAYVLTANHVVPFDGVEVQFTSRADYPKATWYAERPEVVARWPDPDVALIRFPVGTRIVPTLPLAGPGQRPKVFPVQALSIGSDAGQGVTVQADQLIRRSFVRREKAGPAFFWETEKAPEAGRSGGPLLDVKGRVIGICAANRDGHGYYSHLDEILASLKRDGYGWLVSIKE